MRVMKLDDFYFLEVEKDAFVGIDREPSCVKEAKDFVKNILKHEKNTGYINIRVGRRYLQIKGAKTISGT